MAPKKGSTVSRSHLTENLSRNQGSRPLPPSQEMETNAAYAHCGHVPASQSSIMINTNHRAYDNDGISQWAASATGPETLSYGLTGTPNCDDLSSMSVTSSFSGLYAAPFPDDSHNFRYAVPVEQSYALDMSHDDSNTYDSQFSRMQINQDIGQRQGLGLSPYYSGQPSGIDTGTYGLPNAAGLTVGSHPPMVIGNSTRAYDISSTWNGQDMHDFSGPVNYMDSQVSDWTSSMTMTPSTSSLPSEHSFQSHQPDTPISAIMLDGLWPGTNGSMDGEFGIVPPYTLTDSGPIQSNGFHEDQRLAFFSTMPHMTYMPNSSISTIRPNQYQSRAPLNVDLFSAQESHHIGTPQYLTVDGGRRGSDGETRSARDHPFYKIEVRNDGFYYCPFVDTDDCTHRPEKLKCNYE